MTVDGPRVAVNSRNVFGGLYMLRHIESLESRNLFSTHGLNATYFNDVTFTGGATERIDAGVNLQLPNHARPAAGIKGNTFAVRWDGLVQAAHSETYTFS